MEDQQKRDESKYLDQQAPQQRAQRTNDSEGQEAYHCPSCNAPVSATADICERCGQWQMEGQCCFCYSSVRYGQKFCSSCGNPPAGILCKTCNTVSKFDYCPTCDSPLSKRSGEFLKTMEQSPEMLELKKLAEALNRKKDSGNSTPAPPQPPAYRKYVSTFSGPVSAKDYEEEMQKSEENVNQSRVAEVPEVDPQELIKKVEEMQSRVFTDNQSARLFYTSIKILVPIVMKTKKPVGWKCNFASVVHPEGPSACSDPSQGGRWIYEEENYVMNVEL